MLGGGSGPVQVKDSPLLLQQIDALQLSLKHLKNENNLLKVRGNGMGSCGMGSCGIWDELQNRLSSGGLQGSRVSTGSWPCWWNWGNWGCW